MTQVWSGDFIKFKVCLILFPNPALTSKKYMVTVLVYKLSVPNSRCDKEYPSCSVLRGYVWHARGDDLLLFSPTDDAPAKPETFSSATTI